MEWVGYLVVLAIGATLGAFGMGLFSAGKNADLKERLDIVKRQNIKSTARAIRAERELARLADRDHKGRFTKREV